MEAPIPSQITAVLGTLSDPFLGTDLVSAKVIQEIAISQEAIALRLLFPYPTEHCKDQLASRIQAALTRHWPNFHVSVDIKWRVRSHQVQKDLKRKSGIKNIIAVASGKGGVGKSTVAVNLALALKGCGAKVALLDADIYGPSQPLMLGKQGVQASTENKKLVPVQAHGIQSISIGYLVNASEAMIWRGPMVSGALQQLLNDTLWEECDYLILDLPPGTGDIQLTMAQKLPISGAVVVTTPQDIALLDARKAHTMFEKVAIPVLGIVENMSWHQCTRCHHRESVFGAGGGEKMAAEAALPLLGQLPLSSSVRQSGDEGVPIVLAQPESEEANAFWEMAQRVAGTLALRPVDYTITTPMRVTEPA